jgi:streptogramin lyase
MRRALVFAVLIAACAPSPSDDPDAAGGTTDADVPGIDAAPRIDGAPPVAQMFVHTPDTLYVIDDQEFALTLVGPFGLDKSEGGITDMAVTPDGTLYGISNAKLFTLDADTGAASYVADVSGLTNVGLTFLPDGTLLATDQDGGVRRIDPASGVVTEVGAFGGGYATAGDLVAVANGTMYAISDKGPVGDEQDNNVLLTVDTGTGVATGIGQIGYGGVFGCAVANNKVYAFTRDGDVIEIDPTNGTGTLRRSYAGTAFWGAGVTPLAVID